MKITYTGKKKPFSEIEQKKLDARAAKLGKLVERKGEKNARVALSSTRHLHKAEVTLNFFDHPVAGVGSAPDEFQAIIEAIDRAEKQILKLKEKRRSGHRGAVARNGKTQVLAAVMAEGNETGEPGAEAVKVFKVKSAARKPITLEEAMLDLGANGNNYLAYRDAESDKLSILVRRKDGHFDLLEA